MLYSIELISLLAVLAVPAAMFVWMKRQRFEKAQKLEVWGDVPPGDPNAVGDATPPPIFQVGREGFVLLDRFDRAKGYYPEHLKQMVAIMRDAGINGFYEMRGLRTQGVGEYELWAEKEKADLAIQVLREKYFKN